MIPMLIRCLALCLLALVALLFVLPHGSGLGYASFEALVLRCEPFAYRLPYVALHELCVQSFLSNYPRELVLHCIQRPPFFRAIDRYLFAFCLGL